MPLDFYRIITHVDVIKSYIIYTQPAPFSTDVINGQNTFGRNHFQPHGHDFYGKFIHGVNKAFF